MNKINKLKLNKLIETLFPMGSVIKLNYYFTDDRDTVVTSIDMNRTLEVMKDYYSNMVVINTASGISINLYLDSEFNGVIEGIPLYDGSIMNFIKKYPDGLTTENGIYLKCSTSISFDEFIK